MVKKKQTQKTQTTNKNQNKLKIKKKISAIHLQNTNVYQLMMCWIRVIPVPDGLNPKCHVRTIPSVTRPKWFDFDQLWDYWALTSLNSPARNAYCEPKPTAELDAENAPFVHICVSDTGISPYKIKFGILFKTLSPVCPGMAQDYPSLCQEPFLSLFFCCEDQINESAACHLQNRFETSLIHAVLKLCPPILQCT